MFARKVSMHLKPNSVSEFTQRIEKDIFPLLRKQTGFEDEITFIGPGETKAFGISLWDNKQNAEAYNRGTYPEVTKILARVVEGTPRLKPMRFPTLPSTSRRCRSSLKPVGLFVRRGRAGYSPHFSSARETTKTQDLIRT